jgi:hypothetical protein
VDSNGASIHRVLALDTGNYNIGTLAVELQRQLRLGTRIDDGEWTVTSDQEGRLTLNQSSPTASAKLHLQSDVLGRTPVDINLLLATTDGAGNYVARSSSWPQAWSAVDTQETLPNDGDACAIVGLPYRRLEFSPSFQTQTTDHIDLARHRVLHLSVVASCPSVAYLRMDAPTSSRL